MEHYLLSFLAFLIGPRAVPSSGKNIIRIMLYIRDGKLRPGGNSCSPPVFVNRILLELTLIHLLVVYAAFMIKQQN